MWHAGKQFLWHAGELKRLLLSNDKTFRYKKLVPASERVSLHILLAQLDQSKSAVFIPRLLAGNDKLRGSAGLRRLIVDI